MDKNCLLTNRLTFKQWCRHQMSKFICMQITLQQLILDIGHCVPPLLGWFCRCSTVFHPICPDGAQSAVGAARSPPPGGGFGAIVLPGGSCGGSEAVRRSFVPHCFEDSCRQSINRFNTRKKPFKHMKRRKGLFNPNGGLLIKH